MKKDLLDVIDKMQGSPVLVIGDMIADMYLDCTISRISREAPVLVLEQSKERVVAGGATNVVNNAATLGGKVYAAGIIGRDQGGEGLVKILVERNVNLSAMLTDSTHHTICKTRVIAGGRTTVSQQVVRIDNEWHEPLSEHITDELSEKIAEVLKNVKGVVMSDYGSGTITPFIRQQIIEYCRQNGIPSIVDSRYDVLSFRGVDYVKQNDAEAGAAVGYDLDTRDDIIRAGKDLLEKLDAKGILITLGENGMMLFERNGAIHDIPVSDKSEVYDVSGAGDTCVAAVMLALAAGVKPCKAAELSNIAAGIAVRKLGTATVSADELRRVISG